MGVLFFKGCGGGNVKSGSLQGSPRFARGTAYGFGSPCVLGNRERRAYSVPPACRGNLKEGVAIRFYV